MNVGEGRRGMRPTTLTRQPALSAKQIEALRLLLGTAVALATTSDSPALRNTFNDAAKTLQAMLDNDAEAKAR